MQDRLDAELTLLRELHPDLQYREDGYWVLLPEYSLPPGIWTRQEAPVAFQFPEGFPGAAPYGFYVEEPIKLRSGATPGNTANSTAPPFDGRWRKFSWSATVWRPGSEPQSGSNIVNFVVSFQKRLSEPS